MLAAAALLLLPGSLMAAPSESSVELGKRVSFQSSKGNCLACHMIPGGELPGNYGPPLIQMKLRYPDRQKLRAQIWDATATNPQSMMPPFGKHGVLSEKEIDAVVDYMYTL